MQQPHIKPGTNIVLRGKEGVGKSKVGEWIVELFGRNAMVVSESERITGRFNAHLENKLFLMAEEAFWAGDKSAEGKLKDLATGTNMSYERKGLDPYEGKNYTRIMIASNEDWVVPASSGGRRWFVLEVGDEHEKDYPYFAAIDAEMAAGGLAGMLYDLQRTKLPEQINVRSAPVTPWLVDQRLHSYDTKRRWWRDVLAQGGFRLDETAAFIRLSDAGPTCVPKELVFKSARPHFGTERRRASPSEVGTFLKQQLGKVPLFGNGPKLRNGDDRSTTYVFPALSEMRQAWESLTGEAIGAEDAPIHVVAHEPTHEFLSDIDHDTPARRLAAALIEAGVTDSERIEAALAAVLGKPAVSSRRREDRAVPKSMH